MALPYPTKVVLPFDIATAQDMNERHANDVALANGSGLDDGAVTSDKLDLSAVPYFNRVWSNPPGRAAGTTYTNSNAYPIDVSISVDLRAGTAARQARLLVGSSTVADVFTETGNNSRTIVQLTATVPAGETYRMNIVSGSVQVFQWAELA